MIDVMITARKAEKKDVCCLVTFATILYPLIHSCDLICEAAIVLTQTLEPQHKMTEKKKGFDIEINLSTVKSKLSSVTKSMVSSSEW